MNDNIIQIKQLPIIEERLHALKAEIEQKTAEALQLECNDSTLKTVKETRTALRKELEEFEQRRKFIKAQIEQPYKEFEKVYKLCVSDTYKKADTELKAKIDAVEAARKAEKKKKVKEYAEELKAAYGLKWLDTDRIIPNVTLSAGFSSLTEKLAAALEKVYGDVESIGDNAELLAEYQNTLDLAKATIAVKNRHKAIEKAKKQAQETQQQTMAREQAEEKVNQVIAPPIVQAVEKTYKMTFTVVGTISQMKEIKQFLESRGIQYE